MVAANAPATLKAVPLAVLRGLIVEQWINSGRGSTAIASTNCVLRSYGYFLERGVRGNYPGESGSQNEVGITWEGLRKTKRQDGRLRWNTPRRRRQSRGYLLGARARRIFMLGKARIMSLPGFGAGP